MSNRILLVEDDQSFGAVLKDYLSINNFDVTLAIDGELGLKEFTEKEFDICIFDVMMPKKDGFSLSECFEYAQSLTRAKHKETRDWGAFILYGDGTDAVNDDNKEVEIAGIPGLKFSHRLWP